MVVDIINLEPSQSINLNLNKVSESSAFKNPYTKNIRTESDISLQVQVNEDNFAINNQLNYNLKSSLEYKNLALNISNTLNQTSNKLTQLKEIAQQNLVTDISNDTLYANQFKFEQLKNDFNNFVENATYKSQNILQKLNNEGIILRNDETNAETFKLNKFDVEGFNSNTFTIENLNINNENNTKKAFYSLQKAENYFKEEEQRFNSVNNQLSEDLLRLLKENFDTNKMQNNDYTNNEIKDITDLLLKNPNEFYNSQANLIQNSYLELLNER